jgi:hypothetical protein
MHPGSLFRPQIRRGDAAVRADAALSSAATNEGAGGSSGGRNSRTDADGECLTVNRRSGAAQMCDEPGDKQANIQQNDVEAPTEESVMAVLSREASSTLTHPGQ